MPPGWLMAWALGQKDSRRRDLNGLPNLNKDEIPPMPPVKPPRKQSREFTCKCGRKLVIKEYKRRNGK